MSAIGVAFVSLAEGIDATTPAGRLQLHILGAIAEFEKARIAERVKAGLARARAQGRRLGRPRRVVAEALLAPVRGLSVRQAAAKLGVSTATAHRWLTAGRRTAESARPTPFDVTAGSDGGAPGGGPATAVTSAQPSDTTPCRTRSRCLT
jgi:DNA invertase Pin-like site-specific DNA recombinase